MFAKSTSFSHPQFKDSKANPVLLSHSVTNDWSIELLRGLAALLVVFAHYRAMTGLDSGILGFSYTGVDLFFVLSGFVFAPYFFGRKIGIAAHFVRRFFRLYPLYAVALIVYALLLWQPNTSGKYLLKHALFLHTLESREIAFHFNPAFWSLPPEVEFYIVLPVLAFFTGTLRPILVITVIAAFVHVAIAWFSPSYPAVNIISLGNVHLPGLLVEFMFGVIAWWAVGRSPSVGMRIALVATGLISWLGLASVFMTLGDSGIEDSYLLRGNMQFMASFAFALLVTGWVGWLKQPPVWLVAVASILGSLSYGVYLFHNAAPLILSSLRTSMSGPGFALLCLGLTLTISQILHWICEEPCRRFGRRLAKRLVATV